LDRVAAGFLLRVEQAAHLVLVAQLFEGLTMLILYAFEFIIAHAWIYGLGMGAALFAINADPNNRFVRGGLAGIAILSLSPVAAIILAPGWADHLNVGLEYFVIDLLLYPVAVAASCWGAWWFLRHGIHRWEKFTQGWKKASTLERNRRTDIREIWKFLPSNKPRFDPLQYIDFAKGVFLGLSETGQAIYLKMGDWIVSHIMLSGRTRSGKGVAGQILGVQSIRLGECLVILDPKGDKYMPHVYYDECERSGKPWVYLDLRSSAHPQINFAQGLTAENLESVLIGGFSLTEKGTDADHYRIGDRAAARAAAKYWQAHPTATPADLAAEFGEAWQETAAGFLAILRELAELPAVNRGDGQGVNLQALIDEGGCLYVVGDMLNTRIVRCQRILLMILLMMARSRDSLDADPRIIRVFGDEYRVHISRPFIVSLGASAGWRMLSILGFQSFGDLRDCPADLDPDLIEQATIENCAIQLSYRIKDARTAEILAATTGQCLVDDESRKTSKNLAQTETMDGERTLKQAERYLFDVNMITSLPVPDEDKKTIGCGVLIGAGPLAQFCFTSPVMAERTRAAITPTILPPAAQWSAPEVDLDDVPEI